MIKGVSQSYYNKILSIDKTYIWHPYTQMKEYSYFAPLLIVKAKGVKLYDYKGNFYYDTISSWWCNLLGHNISAIAKGIFCQLKELDHTLFAGITHLPAVELIDELTDLVPKHLTKYFFSDNGSTSVEVALKMAYQYWKLNGSNREYFIFLENGYHGDTIGAMSVSGVSQFNNVFSPLFFKSYMIPSPAKDIDGSICRLKRLLSRSADKVAAIILEPILQGAGGMCFYDKQFLDVLEGLREKYGIFVIVDEIATGFGRLGEWFAHTGSKLRPDFMCISKSITNGTLPLALTITTDKVYKAFLGDYAKKTFFHGHTFTANPIACRSAVETIRLLKKGRFLENVAKINRRLVELAEWMKSLGVFESVATKGVILRGEIPGAKRSDMLKIYKLGLSYGLILRPLGNVIYLFLPIAISMRELEDVIERFKQVFIEFLKRGQRRR